MKTFSKGLILGVVILLIDLGLVYLFRMAIPALRGEYMNLAVFRAWEDPLMTLYFLYPFVLAFIVLWVWGLAKKFISGRNLHERGIKFGLVMWVILTLPGMLITYASMQVSLIMVVSWTVSSLISLLAVGWIVSRMHAVNVE